MQHLQDRHGEGLWGFALSKESCDTPTPYAGTREGVNSPRRSRSPGPKPFNRIPGSRHAMIPGMSDSKRGFFSNPCCQHCLFKPVSIQSIPSNFRLASSSVPLSAKSSKAFSVTWMM